MGLRHTITRAAELVVPDLEHNRGRRSIGPGLLLRGKYTGNLTVLDNSEVAEMLLFEVLLGAL